METIPELLERSVAIHASRTAVVGEATGDPGGASSLRWTYAELLEQVRGLAEQLRAAGVGPGDRVAVLEGNTPEYLVAYFAAPWIGAVLQPLNHRLAAAEIDAVLADARTSVLLVGADYAGRVRELEGVTTLALRAPFTAGGERPAGAPVSRHSAQPEDLAQLYYTSGTTGRPKGVMLTHRNACTHAAWAVEELGLSAGDRWGHFAPLFHLADAWATFAVTAVGGLHVTHARFSAEGALGTIERERVTLTNLVPTMLTAMVASPRAAEFDPSSLRMILSGGAPITPALVRRIAAVFRCEYVQTYGMTETSPYLTMSLLDERLRALPEPERMRLAARTGRPFGQVDLQVVDGDGGAVPRDDATVGEIRVRGATVSPGYWERPEETAAAHRDGWLYTGDLAVVDAEGFVDIVDRKKDMILTGGENVYSIEVESALCEHPAVLEAAVFGEADERWGERVCAAVVLAPGAQVVVDELTGFCRERLAGFKVPRRIDFLKALPKTGSGKVSKRALRAPQQGTQDPLPEPT